MADVDAVVGDAVVGEAMEGGRVERATIGPIMSAMGSDLQVQLPRG